MYNFTSLGRPAPLAGRPRAVLEIYSYMRRLELSTGIKAFASPFLLPFIFCVRSSPSAQTLVAEQVPQGLLQSHCALPCASPFPTPACEATRRPLTKETPPRLDSGENTSWNSSCALLVPGVNPLKVDFEEIFTCFSGFR